MLYPIIKNVKAYILISTSVPKTYHPIQEVKIDSTIIAALIAGAVTLIGYILQRRNDKAVKGVNLGDDIEYMLQYLRTELEALKIERNNCDALTEQLRAENYKLRQELSEIKMENKVMRRELDLLLKINENKT